MSAKFIRRTLRNVVFRSRPYFAHLALTHRCNLRCRFCHIQESRFPELDTEGMKRVIDVLDRMGVAVLSISGGGEPLLRPDFDQLLNYAAAKGFYTKLTSNGTMPRERYTRLLASGIREIAISLDGIDGHDLPFSHTSPKILETIRYLNDHLPPGKQLTVNVTVTAANCGQVQRILDYCARQFPNARVWLNPVVMGSGKLRAEGGDKVDPEFLDQCNSPTLLSAGFYKAGVREQYARDTYDWGCKAGEMFFDIKPNGDLWLCQDQPPAVPLNVLRPAFRRDFRRADRTRRHQCSGCTYSCYFVTQKGFEPRNWPGMAGLWWQATTRPGERCRQVAATRGWLPGLLSFCWGRLLATILALAASAGIAAAQPALAPEQVVLRMEQANALRERQLAVYAGTRTYAASNPRLRRQAEVRAEFQFRLPDDKRFHITARSGSKAIQRFVIEPLMDAERDNGRAQVRRDVDICRRNYVFAFREFDVQRRAYVFQLQPRTPNRYLIRGEVWIDERDFAIRRIEGEPARPPSFWVKRTRFVHEYEPFGEFWFPVRHRTEADLRLFGRSVLSIDYYGYRWEKRRP